MEKMYVCKDASMSMQDVYEDLFQHLSEDMIFAERNLGTIAIKYTSFKYKCPIDDNQRIEDPASEDARFMDFMMMLFFYHENAMEDFNWATEEIGSWITRTQLLVKASTMDNSDWSFYDLCPHLDFSNMYKKINNLFTLEGEIVSILDIAHLFSVIDAEALVPGPYLGQEKIDSYSLDEW